jgi:hypothetical protein
LNVDPPDTPDCTNTKRKRDGKRNTMSERELRAFLRERSIISSIGNFISDADKDVASLLTCAKDIVQNSVDAVNDVEPDLDEIKNLTDTLADLG